MVPTATSLVMMLAGFVPSWLVGEIPRRRASAHECITGARMDLAELCESTSRRGAPRTSQAAPIENPPCAAGSRAGATGLEPATSGVTGQFSEGYMDDDRSAIRLIASIFEADRIGPG